MRVGVIGIGHVGLVTAACLAELGHDVVGMDDDQAKVATVAAGGVPFFEPGLEDLVRAGLASGRLRVTGEAAEAIRDAEVVFICVGACTEWDEYRAIAPERLVELFEYPIVVDARNVWRQDDLLAAGLTVASVGSPRVDVPGA